MRRVLSIIPEMYDEIWTGAKGFYKLEPVVADGGEVILYAPHIREISSTHKEIYDIGYHCRDYFVKQWDRFSHVHWGVLAHSTHLRGAGTYDAETGEERLRVQVTLATAIPEDVCRAANLGYLDPASVDVAEFDGRPGHARRAAGRGDAVPAALIVSGRHGGPWTPGPRARPAGRGSSRRRSRRGPAPSRCPPPRRPPCASAR